ncbi:MAG TPA: gephyrin-like molybdotransferase Glp [Phycisphaerae bacterium]|nr:gephyrin-like molybdotransferase Glp [Phycisphaerae bacterium]
MAAAVESLISVGQAQEMILGSVQPGPTVTVPLRSALGRTLAERVVCDIDFPPFNRAMMDGYAVRAADVATVPAALQVVGRVAAGAVAERAVEPGEAMQINTGAPIPPGCDAVVRVEDTQTDGNRVVVRVVASAGRFVARRGEYVRAGAAVLEPGVCLGAGQIAIAATAGRTSLSVYERPDVAILVTGDELVEPGVLPTGGQIRDSNRYVLDGLIDRSGGRPVDLGLVRDDPEALKDKIRTGLATGFLCITGGVSMGEFDFVPQCVTECGATVRFHKLALKPGKPTLFATTDDGACVFGLPGNPVSVFATFWLLVRPALAVRQGRPPAVPRPVAARLEGRVGPTADRQTYRPARVHPHVDGRLVAEPLVWHGSGDPFGLAVCNAMIVTAPGSPARGPGDTIEVLLIEVP